ncbi:MAG: zinc finger MYND domain-containing protein [Candidatus Protochlamydia sp.]|nr:zinc finger MYND domain-containing protein [Candidatus Protochlamydia sp.]
MQTINEMYSWGYGAADQMNNHKNQMEEAKRNGDSITYYKLKNEAILIQISTQKKMVDLASNNPLGIMNHEKIQNLFSHYHPIRETAEKQTQFEDKQIQNQIDQDFNHVTDLSNKVCAQLKEIYAFKKENTVEISKEERFYKWSDETRCHNPGCDKSKFTHILQKCSRCKKALYCGVECQTKDWKAHKPTCKESEF